MLDRLWKWYLGASLVACAVSLAVPEGWLRVGWQLAIGYGAVLAIITGIRRHGPPGRPTWWLFALAVFGNVTGIGVEAVVSNILHAETFPSVADYFYLSLYPAAGIGLVMLIRKREATRDWATIVDAATITTGLFLLAWVFLIRPVAQDPSIGLLGHLVSVAYPVGDVVLMGMVVRLQLSTGVRPVSYWFMITSLTLFLGGDTAWAVISQLGAEAGPLTTHVLNAVFLVAYTLFGAAALHRSVREVGHREQLRSPRLSPVLLLLLTAASLIAPALLLWQVLRHQVTDGFAISLGCFALFLLVVTRLAQLLRQAELQAARVRELSRTDELTGLPNRRAWMSELPSAIERARRDREPLSVAMIDLDHFKRFNDTFGHLAGDDMLRAATAAWQEQLRAVDRLGRYGGEEFILLMNRSGGEDAVGVVERLRTCTPFGQTFSAGVATWDGTETSAELIGRADRALYEAKNTGRDRVVLAETGPRAAEKSLVP